jgi:hypothetical protein
MAQTKTKGTKRSSAGKTSRKAKTTKAKSARKPKAAQSRAKRTSSSSKASRNGSSKANPAKTVGKAVGNAGKDAGHATGQAVRKARFPLVAGGAALAGTLGGVVLGATRSGGRVLGVKLPESKRVRIRSKDLAKAAREVGRFGENMGDLTTEIRRAREGLANGDAKQNSPVEVLLRGLTHRR